MSKTSPKVFLYFFPEFSDAREYDSDHSGGITGLRPNAEHGTTNTVCGTTNTDAGVGIGMKKRESEI